MLAKKQSNKVHFLSQNSFRWFQMMRKMSHLMTKLTKWHVRPAKTQISLGIHPVWSVFAVRFMGS